MNGETICRCGPDSGWTGTWAGVTDEELVVRFREWGCRHAHEELEGRVAALRNAEVRRLARQAGLGGHDVEDALQAGWLAQREAIASYDAARANVRGFRGHLVRVLRWRFRDFVRQDGGQRWCLDERQGVFGTQVLERLEVADRGDGPAEAAAREELVRLVRAVLGLLAVSERAVCAHWTDGVVLAAIARDQGMTYKEARGLRGRTRERLQGQMGTWEK